MAAKKPLISVIIPAYNEEQTIGACLESIARQDIKDKIEVIIVDDDSTDITLEIAKSYAKKLNIRTARNGTKNPERGKRIGLDYAKGKFFMYCDADMSFRDENWFSEMIRPLAENKKVAGCLASFAVNPKDNALTRCISYDIFQRDPIFAAFTPSIKSTIIKKESGYYICKFLEGKIPAQSLCLYRTLLLKKIFRDYYMLMDNDIPVILVKKGYDRI
jgi:glycosyltransferase involved in cell wall biosynthesis